MNEMVPEAPGDASRAEAGPWTAPGAPGEGAAAPRRPRVAIMGEFSAGKSTLSNLLLGDRALPEKVTATQLPPIWIVRGTGDPLRVDLRGGETPVEPARIGDVPVEETRAVRMFREAPILDRCDLIDFPGISDPNMDPEVWERLLPEADVVLWCTHATQAWRRSEAAAWSLVPEAVRDRSLLLVTRFDKIVTERDRARVIRRVEAEAGPLFGGVLPVSLVRALDPGTRPESGFDAFLERLDEVLDAFAPPPSPKAEAPAEAARVVPRRVRPRQGRQGRTADAGGTRRVPS
ncbi:50S ribosome-binding GTPase [Hasllibacter halocynthiae]|uniref:50S ribosome-binding GTPase n=1 Tax=Hasllibacter halocynthiae TaxID=595589 RepID=A0A2T0WZ11_9RHOB|nr:dynamin family protein [Hasllibacter halocynthiae]PRY91921.1 50S ribosome-binding GTPase [Hasllibacter halocynthiae]